MERAREYAARLFLGWLNERHDRSFELADLSDAGARAVAAGAQGISIGVAELFEADEAWSRRCRELAARLNSARPGSYLLWVPPGGDLPGEEPEESEWVRRVVLGASRLASGRSGEVRLPVRLALGKVRDEGGYASVTGGLGRHWTEISSRLQGSFYLDSRGLNRLTADEGERERLYEHIGLLSQGLESGNVAEFEHEDAWAVQRLARGPAGEGMEDGWAITGCPTGFEPNDGGAIRRLLRRRLTEALAQPPTVGDLRVLVLIGAYERIEYENAGPSLRGFDPSLAAAFDLIALVSEAQVKPIFQKRGLLEGR
jgi:hypothetical protein